MDGVVEVLLDPAYAVVVVGLDALPVLGRVRPGRDPLRETTEAVVVCKKTEAALVVCSALSPGLDPHRVPSRDLV